MVGHRLTVGVDYGTTFSGIAFAAPKISSLKEVNTVTNWPGGSRAYEHLEKVPSRIAYKSENPKLKEDAWGYEVEDGWVSYCWTKLLLDQKTKTTDYDDPSLRETSGGAGLKLPPGKKAVDVVSDYLSHLYEHCMKRLEMTLTPEVLNITGIDFWMTMPAIWSDEAQYATKTAAERAGFGRRPGDEVRMIREPEAAALAAFKITTDSFDDLLKANTGVLVCDCGGGTVDINTYTIVEKKEKNLQLEECCVGIGGKCGATYVDRNLHDLMTRRYGDSFTKLPITRRGPGSRFMMDFEAKKKDFRGIDSRESNLRLVMKDIKEGAVNCFQYDPDECEVTLTSQDMKSCFDPVIAKIMGLVSAQVKAVAREGAPPIKNLILVGGFGASPYLWNCLKEWCEQNGGIRPISPDRPWSAIARGAALRGRGGHLVAKHRCRRHYGTSIARPFKPATEPKDERVYRDEFSDTDYRKGWMKWQIQKGEKIYRNTKKEISFHLTLKKGQETSREMTLHACDHDMAPRRDDDPYITTVGKICYDLSGVNLEQFKRRKTGKLLNRSTYYDTLLKCEVAMADESGILQFRIMCQGKELGAAKIEFTPED